MGLKCQKLAPLGLLGGTPHAGQAVAVMYLNRGPECVLGLPYREGRGGDEEFYEIIALPDTILELNRLLQDWERVCNTIRCRQALGYRTPLQAVLQFRQQEVT